MPLTKKMKEIKRNFQIEYGRERGERMFYAWENKSNKKKKLKK